MEIKKELIWSQTGTTERPKGMQPCGIYPDLIRLTHKNGTIIQVPCDRSQHKSYEFAMSLMDLAIDPRK